MTSQQKLSALRRAINENLRVQRGGADPVDYIDVANVVDTVTTRQNHTIFARRGCGKTLLLHHSTSRLDDSIKAIYLNCEDFKHHSFPNVLIEILDALFNELEKHLSGWFGRKKRSRELVQEIRKELADLRVRPDSHQEDVKETTQRETKDAGAYQVKATYGPISLGANLDASETAKRELQRSYRIFDEKIKDLNALLPKLKGQIREFFDVSTAVKAVFIELDDLYHLRRVEQPFVVDYIHRLCKDVPLFFKIATLRHASTLYADRAGQPIGAQERHDYQPINIDFTFSDFTRTREQNKRIFEAFGAAAGLEKGEITALFKGEGFDRLLLAGGGVPRDCLSLFLEVLDQVQAQSTEAKIGKDEIRTLSRSNFERRIEELKQDSEGSEQATLIRGIYVIRTFCISKKTNVFLVSEQMMQQEDALRTLIYRLLDYRIIHSAGSALTHKSQTGTTFQAFAIDIGSYANMRKLAGRFNEIDLAAHDAKERMRSAPILERTHFAQLWTNAPSDPETQIMTDTQGELPE